MGGGESGAEGEVAEVVLVVVGVGVEEEGGGEG